MFFTACQQQSGYNAEMIKLHTIPKYCPHVLRISNRRIGLLFLDNIPHYAHYFFAIKILLAVNNFLSQKMWGYYLSSKRCVILTDTTLGILFASLSEPLQAYLLKWSSCYFWLQCVKPSRTFLFFQIGDIFKFHQYCIGVEYTLPMKCMHHCISHHS